MSKSVGATPTACDLVDNTSSNGGSSDSAFSVPSTAFPSPGTFGGTFPNILKLPVLNANNMNMNMQTPQFIPMQMNNNMQQPCFNTNITYNFNQAIPFTQAMGSCCGPQMSPTNISTEATDTSMGSVGTNFMPVSSGPVLMTCPPMPPMVMCQPAPPPPAVFQCMPPMQPLPAQMTRNRFPRMNSQDVKRAQKNKEMSEILKKHHATSVRPKYLAHQKSNDSNLSTNDGSPKESTNGNDSVKKQEFYPWHLDVPRYTDFQYEYGRKQKGDGITTLMLRNIPNRFHPKNLFDELDKMGLKHKYDFFYLPMDLKNESNVGYAFVNFRKPRDAARCRANFEGYKFLHVHSAKVGSVANAHVQGYENNVRHFSGRAVVDALPEFRPYILDKDGKTLTPMGDFPDQLTKKMINHTHPDCDQLPPNIPKAPDHPPPKLI
eukprot:gene356-710_t